MVSVIEPATERVLAEVEQAGVEQTDAAVARAKAAFPAWRAVAPGEPKGGVLALSRELGVEFARRGVRVNALCPGPVNTPDLYATDPEQAARRLVHLPMGRFAEAREIAQGRCSWRATSPPMSRPRPSWAALSAPRPGCSGRTRYTSRTRVVYSWCMSRVRTNIEIEETYVEAIMDRYGARTKTEAVDLALRHLAGQPMTREQALAMRGAHAIAEPPPDASPRGAA